MSASVVKQARLTVQVPVSLKQKIKMEAVKRKTSVRTLMLELIAESLFKK